METVGPIVSCKCSLPLGANAASSVPRRSIVIARPISAEGIGWPKIMEMDALHFGWIPYFLCIVSKVSVYSMLHCETSYH